MNIGGPAIHVHLLSDGLQGYGFETLLVTGRLGEKEGDFSEDLIPKNYERRILRSLQRELSPVKDFISLVKLIALIRRWKPDIVHTHTAKAGLVGRVAAWICRVPVIVHTFHGHVFHSYFGILKTRLFILLERFCGKISDRILCLTEGQRRDILALKIGSKEKIEILPLGLDLQRFLQTPRKLGKLRTELGVSVGSPLVGFVGRLVEVKNLPLFLDAAECILREVPDSHFVIAGDGELRPELENRVRLSSSLRDRVHFLGWRRDLEYLYSDFDALVCSSKNEGTPVSLIEAMASSCPVVSTNVGGVADLLVNGRFGHLVKPGDAEELSSVVTNLLASRDQTSVMTRDAREYVENNFRTNQLNENIGKLYNRLLLSAG